MGEKVTPVEKRIIEYLSLNLDKNAQQIQREIGYEDKNYPTVANALKRLEKKHYIEHKKGRSKKKVTIKFYKLSRRGVLIAFETNSEATLIKTLGLYKATSETFQLLKQFISFLEPSTAIKVLRMSGALAYRHGKKYDSIEAMLTPIVLNAVSGLEDFTEEEITKLAEAAIKTEKLKMPLKATFELGHKLFSGKRGKV